MNIEGILAIEPLEKMEQMHGGVQPAGPPLPGSTITTQHINPRELHEDDGYEFVPVKFAADAMRNVITVSLKNSPVATREYASYVCKHAGSTTVLGFMSGATERLRSGRLWERFQEASKAELVPIDLGVGSHQIVFYQSHFYMADDFKPGALKVGTYDIHHSQHKKTEIIDIAADNPPAVEAGTKQRLIDLYGGAVSSETFGELIGISRQAVDKQANSGNLLRFKKGSRNWNYPSWQAHNGAILEGLRETLKALEKRSHWSKLLFFVSANRYLEGVLTEKMGTSEITPIDALRQGHVEQVLASIEGDR